MVEVGAEGRRMGDKKGRVEWRRGAERLEVRGLGAVEVAWGSLRSLPEDVLSFVAEAAALLCPRALWIVDGSEEEAVKLRAPLTAQGVMHSFRKHPNTFIVRTDPADVARFEDKTWIVCPERTDVEPDEPEPTAPQPCHARPPVLRSPSRASSSTSTGVSSMAKGSKSEIAARVQLAQWMSPARAEEEAATRFPGAMRGRVMFIIPFSMGLPGLATSLPGVELTDSPYVVLCMRLITHIGLHCLQAPSAQRFVRCIHTLGCPLPLPSPSIANWDCNTKRAIVLHWPQERRIWSYGSGFGGNSLLGKKCLALRLAAWMGREEGWFAAHMSIFSLTRESDGVRRYFGAAFPSTCGKTHLSFLKPAKPGYQIHVIGDDIAWLRWNPATGRLCASCPENGFFGIATHATDCNAPNMMAMLRNQAIITNVGETTSGDFFWEGLEDGYKEKLDLPLVRDWTGKLRALTSTPRRGDPPYAHPNARFAAPYAAAPNRHEAVTDPYGVPLDAIIFGSRRSTTFPLVYEASHHILRHNGTVIKSEACTPWIRGSYIGASLCSEAPLTRPPPLRTNAELKRVAAPEPFAMRPFLATNLGRLAMDWIRLGTQPRVDAGVQPILPRVYHVNWYREDEETGSLLWPGFGENIRVLEWMMKRLDEGPEANGVPSETGKASLLGVVPGEGQVDLSGLKVKWEPLMEQSWVDLGEEAADAAEFFRRHGGPEFPEALAICGLHHLSVAMDNRSHFGAKEYLDEKAVREECGDDQLDRATASSSSLTDYVTSPASSPPVTKN